MSQKRRRRRLRQRKSQTQRGQRKNQLGEGEGAVAAGIPKAASKITKGLETLAKKKMLESFETYGRNQKW